MDYSDLWPFTACLLICFDRCQNQSPPEERRPDEQGGEAQTSLFCVADSSSFADNRNLNLTRISHFVLNTFCDFC